MASPFDTSEGLLDFLTSWGGAGDWLDIFRKPDDTSLFGLLGIKGAPQRQDDFLTRFLSRGPGRPPDPYATLTRKPVAPRTPKPQATQPARPTQSTQLPNLPPITARFGETGPHWRQQHRGMDYAVGLGTPISPVDVGTVMAAGWDDELGNYVQVQHAWGTSTYAHGSELLVQPGQPIAPGMPLMFSGTSGLSEGPHLHLEIEVGGKPVDPTTFLTQQGLSMSGVFGQRTPSYLDEGY